MSRFKRAFGATFSVTLLIIFGLLAMSLVSEVSEKNGFSSGEFFGAEFSEGVLKTEFLGEKFTADLRPALFTAKKLEPAAILLPPQIQLVLRMLRFEG